MAKNKTKQAKFKEVSFKIQTRDFKRALSNVLINIGTYKNEYSILNGVKIHAECDYLEMTATGGMVLVKATVGLDEEMTGMADMIISGLHLSKMKLVKSYTSNNRGFSVFDILQFTVKENEVLITDNANGVTYRIPKLYGQYPKTEELLQFKYDAKKHTRVALNPRYLARFKDVPNRDGKPIILYFDKNNPLAPVHIETEDPAGDGVDGYKGVVMPIQLRE